VLPAVRSVYVELLGEGMLGIALRALIAAVLLLPPTALMEATLPAIARRYGAARHVGGGCALRGQYLRCRRGVATFGILPGWWFARRVGSD
jgi:hypothetical protein